MRKTKTDKIREAIANEKPLEIPEDEIWTYQIEGLQAPRIVDKSVSLKTKISIILFLIIAITLSIFFSIRAVSNQEFDYKELDNGYQFVKYSNPGGVTEVNVDYVDGDKTKPVTEIREYAFNCDEKIQTVYVGKDVEKIDGKSFYSCWSLENVFVDKDNPCYCDIDGVLYNKDLSQIIYYPSAHNIYLTRQLGYEVNFPEDGSVTNDDFCSAVKLLAECKKDGKDTAALTGDDKTLIEKFVKLTGVTDFAKFSDDYAKQVGIYVLPSSVTEVGKLAFAYSDIEEIYLPEGLRSIGTLGFFKTEKLKKIYSYKTAAAVTDTTFASLSGMSVIYESLPDGLEFIGSDAFTYDRGITYLYVPSSVKQIDHNAFYNMTFKSDDEIEGVAQVNVQADEESFSANTKLGSSWLPKIDAGLFEKDVEVIYSSVRNPVK